jgi:peptidoglycan/LPS O-acetylase OafA/YrhL
VTGRYLPGLDGLRAVAVAGVIAYHLGYGWASGGYLGVDLFFVLSGFLITSLLVEEWLASGAIRFSHFWGRRARRLLPALLLMIVVVVGFVATQSSGLPIDWGELRGQALATVFYVANWHLLFAHQSYFDQYAVQSPLQHTWSLGIEEQFYIVWPIVILGMLKLVSRARRRVSWRKAGLFLTVGGFFLSAAWMFYLKQNGASVNRLYYGTDTRAFDLLAGAALAMMVVGRAQPARSTRRRLHVASMLAIPVLAYCWIAGGVTAASTPNAEPRPWMFQGGLAVCAIAAAVVMADVRCADPGLLGRALAVRPLRYIGRISYGLYLWHWPVIVEITSARIHVSGLGLTAVRIAITLVISILSFHLVEQPIRRGFSRTPIKWPRVALAPAAMAATVVVVLVATVPPAVATATAGRVVSTAPTVAGAGGVVGGPIDLGQAVTPSHPLRLLLLGDSVMLTEAPAIEALFDSTKEAVVDDRSEWGFGLSRVPDWPTVIPQWIAQARPDVVVCMWSWDNSFFAAHPTTYRAELVQFIRLVLRPGDGVKGVVFQQFPAPGPDQVLTDNSPDYDARVSALIDGFDSLADSLTRQFPRQLLYVPIGSAVLLHGKFTTWLPPEGRPDAPASSWIRVRQVDNVHFCPAGAARYAAALLADLTPMLKLGKPGPDWSTGPWTSNHLAYRYPNADVCPDDHP